MSLISLRSAVLVLFLSLSLLRLPARVRPLTLLVCSLLFFAVSPELLALHALHTALTLVLAFLIRRFRSARRPLLAVGILAHSLAFVWLRGRGGFSYAALMHIGFLLDADLSSPTAGLQESAAALTWFPVLQEGPILDARRFANQLSQPEPLSWERGSLAVLRIVAGLVKKLVVADRMAAFVDAAYSAPQTCTTGALWLAMLVYAVQIYMDFSGCMDVVLGVCALTGFDLPENFRRPYLADSCSEYWRRWHITMGSWFRHRVFYPLAASLPMLKLAGRLGRAVRSPLGAGMAAAVPMLLTWTLVGLWHGFASHYALWGLLNGFLILMESFRLSIGSHWPKAARIARTFLALCLIRVLFRADSLKSAGQFYVGLFRPQGGALPLDAPLPGFLVAVLFALFFFALELHEEREGKPEIGVSAALTLTALGIACVMIFGCYGPGYSPTEFFYNRF